MTAVALASLEGINFRGEPVQPGQPINLNTSPYHLSVYNSTTQSIPNNTFTPISFDTTISSSNIAPITTSTTVFTLPTAGVYQINYSILYPVAGALALTWIQISSSSGARFAYDYQLAGVGFTGTASLYFNAGDTFTIMTEQATGAAAVTGNTSYKVNSMQVVRVSD